MTAGDRLSSAVLFLRNVMSDTIAAISTAPGSGGIGIIRISGEEAWQIAGKMLHLSEKVLSSIPSHTIRYGHVYDGDTLLDEVLVSFMRGPRTYTREDVVEVNCHGGSLVTKKVLSSALACGARLAEPGEFTRRAFLSGRIDLSQAEAVMDVIRAEGGYALKSAERQLSGTILSGLRPVEDQILLDVAAIEAALDDPEHLSLDGKKDEIRQHVEQEKKTLIHILAHAKDGQLIREGVKTVILGKPNVGKSSFLNLLSGREVAIVTDIPGTTRDALEETILLGDMTLRIVDTAGIRETENQIEQIGIRKAREHAEDADLLLVMFDASKELDAEDLELLHAAEDKTAIVIFNKTDLSSSVPAIETKLPVVTMSMVEGSGLEELTHEIEKLFFGGKIDFAQEIFLANIRQEDALKRAVESLDHVLESLDIDVSEEFLTIDLMDAYNALGEITGDTTSEDLVNKIFSEFCMGK